MIDQLKLQTSEFMRGRTHPATPALSREAVQLAAAHYGANPNTVILGGYSERIGARTLLIPSPNKPGETEVAWVDEEGSIVKSAHRPF